MIYKRELSVSIHWLNQCCASEKVSTLWQTLIFTVKRHLIWYDLCSIYILNISGVASPKKVGCPNNFFCWWALKSYNIHAWDTPPPLYIKHFSTDLRESQEGSEQKWGVRTLPFPPVATPLLNILRTGLVSRFLNGGRGILKKFSLNRCNSEPLILAPLTINLHQVCAPTFKGSRTLDKILLYLPFCRSLHSFELARVLLSVASSLWG